MMGQPPSCPLSHFLSSQQSHDIQMTIPISQRLKQDTLTQCHMAPVQTEPRKSELPMVWAFSTRLGNVTTYPERPQESQREEMGTAPEQGSPRCGRQEESHREPAFLVQLPSAILPYRYCDMRKTVFPSKTCYEV